MRARVRSVFAVCVCMFVSLCPFLPSSMCIWTSGRSFFFVRLLSSIHSISVFFFINLYISAVNLKMRISIQTTLIHDNKNRQKKIWNAERPTKFTCTEYICSEKKIARKKRAKSTNNKVEKSMWIDIKPKKSYLHAFPISQRLHLTNRNVKWCKKKNRGTSTLSWMNTFELCTVQVNKLNVPKNVWNGSCRAKVISIQHSS